MTFIRTVNNITLFLRFSIQFLNTLIKHECVCAALDCNKQYVLCANSFFHLSDHTVIGAALERFGELVSRVANLSLPDSKPCVFTCVCWQGENYVINSQGVAHVAMQRSL